MDLETIFDKTMRLRRKHELRHSLIFCLYISIKRIKMAKRRFAYTKISPFHHHKKANAKP